MIVTRNGITLIHIDHELSFTLPESQWRVCVAESYRLKVDARRLAANLVIETLNKRDAH